MPRPFWCLPPVVQPENLWLDGHAMVVEGRLHSVFRATLLENPETDELRQLGRIAFDLAGLAHVPL